MNIKPLALTSLFCAIAAMQLSHVTIAEDTQHAVEISSPALSGRFDTLKEPSGVTALDHNTLLVIEDEASRALRRLDIIEANATDFEFSEHEQLSAPGFINRRLLGPLDDLEGIARLSSEYFFVIGSHENASRGKEPLREKLALLSREDTDAPRTLMRQDLYEQLASHYPGLAEETKGRKAGHPSALNIEGLAFDRKRNRLLIALRAPTIDKQAVIVSLENAVKYLEGDDPEFGKILHLVNMDRQGIRALAYDDLSDQLFVVGKRESGGNKRFSLWTLDAQTLSQPIRYKSKDRSLFKDVEGLAPFAEGFLFLRDGGGKSKNKDDDWFILSRSQLGLDEG